MIKEISPERKARLRRGLRIVLIVFLVVIIVNCAVESMHWDRSDSNKQENVISFSGHGEVSAVPNIANVSFTIQKDATTVKDAENGVAEIEKASLAFLRANNVADKDFKTTDSSFYPKYEYRTEKAMPCPLNNCPPPVSNSVIVGYTASESITVKIRNIDDAGKIIQGLGTIGVSDLNGPNFTVDNEDSFKDAARKLAIDEAKAKAKVLAQDLGIRLGKITSFSENGNNPMPMYAKAMNADNLATVAAPAEIPTGENLITSDVTITYELK